VFKPSLLVASPSGIYYLTTRRYRGGGVVSEEAGVLDAVGRIGTAGVLDAAGCTESTAACVGIAGPFVFVGRILNATLATCPAGTVTLSSA
jgi:hypothetical protein